MDAPVHLACEYRSQVQAVAGQLHDAFIGIKKIIHIKGIGLLCISMQFLVLGTQALSGLNRLPVESGRLFITDPQVKKNIYFKDLGGQLEKCNNP